jgi:hypothetical protein
MRTQMYDSNSTNLNSNSSLCFFLPFAFPAPTWLSITALRSAILEPNDWHMVCPPDTVSSIYDAAINNVVHLVTGYILDRQSGNMTGSVATGPWLLLLSATRDVLPCLLWP